MFCCLIYSSPSEKGSTLIRKELALCGNENNFDRFTGTSP